MLRPVCGALPVLLCPPAAGGTPQACWRVVHKLWNHEFRIPGWLLVHGGAWSSPSSPLGMAAVMGMDEMPAAFWRSLRAPEVGRLKPEGVGIEIPFTLDILPAASVLWIRVMC